MTRHILRELASYLDDPDKVVSFIAEPEAIIVSFDGAVKAGRSMPLEVLVPLDALTARLPTLGANAAMLFPGKSHESAGLLLLAALIDEVAHDSRLAGDRGFVFTAEGKFARAD